MRILVAEDENTSRLILVASLRKLGHEVVSTCDGREAWDRLQTEEFAIVISDWMMPGLTGLELCRLIRSSYHGPYLYTIMITALDEKADYLAAMEAGADDFITKPVDIDQLAARLRVAERILNLQEKLRSLALHDSLTGLLSRAAILQVLSHELGAAERTLEAVGVVICDLDHFKKINDTHGHLVGDAVLMETALRMAASIRTYDRIGRYGGEEFLIVLPHCSAADAASLAERVRTSVSRTELHLASGSQTVTCSVGVAVSAPGLNTADALIRAADLALYSAKADGRNRVGVAGRCQVKRSAGGVSP